MAATSLDYVSIHGKGIMHGYQRSRGGGVMGGGKGKMIRLLNEGKSSTKFEFL